MSNMVRKQIYLERRQVRAVQRNAKALGLNASELIRQAIDRDLSRGSSAFSYPDPAAWDEIEAFLASQADKPLEGNAYHFNREEIYGEGIGGFDGTDSD